MFKKTWKINRNLINEHPNSHLVSKSKRAISTYPIEWNRFNVSVAIILQSDSMVLRSISDEMSPKPREV